jgi:ribonuclease HI
MAALNRFISKLGERGLPFFKLLKRQEKFVWTPEADQALAQLKDFLSKPPVLTAPRKCEQLLLYLAATTHVVSTAVIVERQEDGRTYLVQRPVYFLSEVLSESMARYQPVQKLLYAVLITSRKLRHYFDGSLNLEGTGVGVLLISPMGEQLKYVLQIFWRVSNNEAEYEALLHGLHLSSSLGIKRLLVYGDSTVVINHVNKSWDRNKENMDAYCLEVASSRTSSTVSSSTTSSATTTLLRTSYRSLVLLALKYQRVSSSTSFTRHPFQSQRHRPLSQRVPRLARRS